MIIDFHTHIAPRELREMPNGTPDRDWYGITVRREEDGGLIHSVGDHTGRLTHPPRQGPEERIRDMDAMGVDLQVLSMSPALAQYRAPVPVAATCAREVNDEFAELTTSYPGRFAGFAHLPLQDTDAAITELERAMSIGLYGACLPTHVNGENWDEARLYPVLEAAERLHALLFFHPIQIRVRDLTPRHHLRNLLGNPWETAVTIASLIFGGVLDRLSGLRTVFAHGGGYAPYAAGRFDHGWGAREDTKGSARLPSSYLKGLAFDCITHSEQALRYLVDTVGGDNVVLGSDYPADMSSGSPAAGVRDSSALTDEEKAAILEVNGQRLLGTG